MLELGHAGNGVVTLEGAGPIVGGEAVADEGHVAVATTALDDAGSLAGSSNGINKSLLDISNQRDVINRKLTSTEARYRKQFNSLDTLISNLNATGNFLTQQIQYLPTPGKTTSK